MRRRAQVPARVRTRDPRARLRAQDGSIIIEVIVSALVIGLLAVGIFTSLDAASATSGSSKSRAIGADLAQADQERLRAMKVADLSNRRETRVVPVAGVNFTVVSRADWVTDSSGSASCSTGSARADYIKISSTVSWPAMSGLKPVVLTSVVAPPNGSFGTNTGTLAIEVVDAAGAPVAGKQVTLTGPQGATEVTNELGCVLLGFLPAGNYTATLGSGCIDRSGADPVTKPVGVVGEAITTVSLDCAPPASLNVSFDTVAWRLSLDPPAYDSPQASNGRYASVAHSGMAAPFWRAFGNGTPTATIAATGLFPFADPYAVYSGNCAAADPRTAPNQGTAVLQVAGAGSAVTVRQPALNLNVVNKSTGVSLLGATVKAYPRSSGCGGTLSMGTTDSFGQLPDPGAPYGLYDVCAQFNGRKATVTNVQNYQPTGTALTTIQVPVNGGSSSCPS